MTLPVDKQLKPVYPLNNNWNDTKKDKKLNTYNIIQNVADNLTDSSNIPEEIKHLIEP